MSKEQNEFHAALCKAQAEMPAAAKDADNSYFNTSYADLRSVQRACMPALTSNGFSVFQRIEHRDDSMWLVTDLCHSGGHVMSSPVPLVVNKKDMQGLGSAMTYARRYGLMAAAGVAADDDDGNAAAKAPGEMPKKQVDASPAADSAIMEIQISNDLDAIMTMFQGAVRGASEDDRQAIYQAVVNRVELLGVRPEFEERMAELRSKRRAA